MIRENQELLTQSKRSAGKNLCTELTSKKLRKAFWETEQGAGHQGIWAFQNDLKTRRKEERGSLLIVLELEIAMIVI